MFFFFFKQKTAYEMRISDWSSDVCSSDLDFGFVIAGDEGGARADLHRAEIAGEEGERVGVGPGFRGNAAFGPVGAQRKSAGIGAPLHRGAADAEGRERGGCLLGSHAERCEIGTRDRQSTRLNSSH